MILKCPNCSTPFNVPKGAIPPDGRRVKCAKCAHKWHAYPGDAVQLPPIKTHPDLASNTIASAQSPDFLPQRPADLHESPDDLQQDAAFAARHADLRKDLSGEGENDGHDPSLKRQELFGAENNAATTDLPGNPPSNPLGAGIDDTAEPDFMARVRAGLDGNPMRDLEENEPDTKEGREDTDFVDTVSDIWDHPSESDSEPNKGRFSRKKFYTAGWSALLVLWLAVFIGFFGFKDQVQAIWPGSSIFYTKLNGLKDTERFRENADSLSKPITDSPRMVEVGLASDVTEPYRWDFKNGQSHLTLKLVVSNKGARAATVPKLLVTFLGLNNDVLKVWTIDPPGKTLTRGAYLDFEISRPDYPVGIKNIVVTELENSVTEGRADT